MKKRSYLVSGELKLENGEVYRVLLEDGWRIVEMWEAEEEIDLEKAKRRIEEINKLFHKEVSK
jgi:hypothetical protein